MLDTYIKNRGTTKTLIYNNNHNNINEIHWDADYDGNTANISLDLQNNGKQKHYDIIPDNEDLANILNVPSVQSPLEKRLKRDFNKSSVSYNPHIYKIEFENFKTPPLIPKPYTEKFLDTMYKDTPQLASSLQNKEFIIPLTIDNKTKNKYTLTPKRRNKKTRTRKTNKVNKKPHITKSKSKISKSKKNRSKSK
jgi:hypothetical protein